MLPQYKLSYLALQDSFLICDVVVCYFAAHPHSYLSSAAHLLERCEAERGQSDRVAGHPVHPVHEHSAACCGVGASGLDGGLSGLHCHQSCHRLLLQ